VAAAGKKVLSRVGVALCLACVVVGCGSDAAVPADDGTADTARVELVITRTDREGMLAMRGIYDYRRREGSVTTTLEGTADAGSDTPTEVRFFGDRYYSQYPGEGRTYWIVDGEGIGIGYPAEVIVPFPEGDVDPKESLERMFAAGDEVEVGKDEVREVETTHYRVMLEPKRLSKVVGRPLDLADGPFSVDVWADDARRVRRIRIVEEEVATLTYEFYDFGVAVDVRRPPEDEVVTRGGSIDDDELCRREKKRLEKKGVHIDCLE
jgi:hypothetical protein